MRAVAMITDERLLGHLTGGDDHPETPGRLTALWERLEGQWPGGPVRRMPSRKAEWPWLLAAHSESYLYRFEETVLAGKSYVDHPDNQVCYETYEAALLAAGSGPAGIDLLEGGGEVPFCAVRPPGHHAEASRAMGFCFLNNAVVAARYWQTTGGRRKIFILDWDAHHGNGIQRAFEEDPEVFYASLHEHPTFSFPGTGQSEERGTGRGEGATLNIPLLPGAGDKAALAALREQVEPALERFRPDAIIVAAGFDGHALDDMSGLEYSTALYGELGRMTGRWGRELCGGRVLTMLEGGYHLEAMADSAEAYLTGLAAEG